jgi:hypothetical protein
LYFRIKCFFSKEKHTCIILGETSQSICCFTDSSIDKAKPSAQSEESPSTAETTADSTKSTTSGSKTGKVSLEETSSISTSSALEDNSNDKTNSKQTSSTSTAPKGLSDKLVKEKEEKAKLKEAFTAFLHTLTLLIEMCENRIKVQHLAAAKTAAPSNKEDESSTEEKDTQKDKFFTCD